MHVKPVDHFKFFTGEQAAKLIAGQEDPEFIFGILAVAAQSAWTAAFTHLMEIKQGGRGTPWPLLDPNNRGNSLVPKKLVDDLQYLTEENFSAESLGLVSLPPYPRNGIAKLQFDREELGRWLSCSGHESDYNFAPSRSAPPVEERRSRMMTASELAYSFRDIVRSQEDWQRMLQDPPKWLEGCFEKGAGKGKARIPNQWNPLLFAKIISAHAHQRADGSAVLKALSNRFKNEDALKPLLADWREHLATNYD